MGKKLENIFNECLERVLRGESIEDSLKSYPKEAAKLEPLLKVAFTVHKNTTSIQPRPTFKEQTFLNLRGAFLYARRQKQLRPKPEVSFWGWQRRWAFAVTIILIVFIVGAGTTAASNQALPDELLYPVKLATEQVRLTLAFSNMDKAELQARFAERRAKEITAMARQGKIAYITRTIDRLAIHLEKAEGYAVSMRPPKPEAKVTPPLPAPIPPVPPERITELKKLLDESAPRSLAALELALQQAPEQAKPALRHAIEMNKKKYQKILEKLEERGMAPPTLPVAPEQKGPPERKKATRSTR